MSLTKQTIVERISKKLDLHPKQTKETIEILLEAVKSTLASGEDIMISGFGKFKVHEKAPRKGRNPATGKAMTLKKRKVIAFKCSDGLKDQLNGEKS